MQIGIIDYLLRVREEATFYMAAQLGFECLEMTVDRIDEEEADRPLFGSMRDLGDLGRSSGIPVRSFYCTYFLSQNLFATEEKSRQANLAALRRVMTTAAHYEVPTVVIPMFGASFQDEQGDRDAFDAVFAEVLGWEETSQVRVALKSLLPARKLREWIDRHSSQLGVCFDPANSAPLKRDVTEEIYLLKDRIYSVHLKDRGPKGESNNLGLGSLDLPKLLQALRDIHYDGPMILETPSGRSAVESARNNLEAFRLLAV